MKPGKTWHLSNIEKNKIKTSNFVEKSGKKPGVYLNFRVLTILTKVVNLIILSLEKKYNK